MRIVYPHKDAATLAFATKAAEDGMRGKVSGLVSAMASYGSSAAGKPKAAKFIATVVG